MKKENIKTILLSALIIGSLFLTKELWFNEKLWSSDYNFFANLNKNNIVLKVKEFFPWFSSENPKVTMLKEHIFYPKKIIVNFSEFREIFYYDDDEYYEFLDESDYFLNGIKEKLKIVKSVDITEDEWHSALKSKSILIDYGINMGSRVFENLLGLEANSLKPLFENVDRILIIPETGPLKTYNIYIDGNDLIKKIVINNVESNFNSLFDKYENNDPVRYTYSFERGFDEKRANKIVIESEVLIPRNNILMDSISYSSSYLNSKEQLVENILDAFEYGSTLYREHTEIDNTKVFVKNYSTLKVNADNGYIQYKVVEAGQGIKLSVQNKEKYELYESLEMAINFLEKLDLLDETLKITSDLTYSNNDSSIYRFTFDCYYKGIPVIINSSNYGYMHKAEIEISKGKISYFKGCTKEYGKEDSIIANRNILQALDMLYNQLDIEDEEIIVNKIYMGYVINGEKNEYLPQWVFEINNDGKIYTVDAVQ